MYSGDWESNIKKGTGTHTFEDGRVYKGVFEDDQMRDYQIPVSTTSTALQTGNEDNPVRRCIDISDLEPIALPPDVGSHDLTVGSGHDETHEIMREVHNMLLRILGVLKKIYY